MLSLSGALIDTLTRTAKFPHNLVRINKDGEITEKIAVSNRYTMITELRKLSDKFPVELAQFHALDPRVVVTQSVCQTQTTFRIRLAKLEELTFESAH